MLLQKWVDQVHNGYGYRLATFLAESLAPGSGLLRNDGAEL